MVINISDRANLNRAKIWELDYIYNLYYCIAYHSAECYASADDRYATTKVQN
jgi:hypothetical protein